MTPNELSKNIFELLVDPAKKLEPITKIFEELVRECRSEAEFVARHREIVMNFYSLREASLFHLVQEDFDMPNDWQPVFKRIIEKMKANHDLLKPERRCGELQSEKNGMIYNFVYGYVEKYLITKRGMCIVFNITRHGEEEQNGFSFILRRMENGNDLKVVDLYPDVGNEYLGKGISISMIRHVKDKYRKRIVSSSNKKGHNLYREFNSAEAIEKVWEKMRKQGYAEYDEKGDYYFTI